MKQVFIKTAPITLLAAGLAMAGCEEQLGVEAGAQTSVSFAATGGNTLLGDPTPPQNPVTIDGHVIAVTSVELTPPNVAFCGVPSCTVRNSFCSSIASGLVRIVI